MIDGQWEEAQLRALPVERGVRLRGVEATRIDTFVWSLMLTMPLQNLLLARRRRAES